jgi:phytoene dehydrogenase-like protein
MTNNDSKPDVIIIGAGINALGAAYTLCNAGWRVLVLDRNAQPGGAIRTQELTLPGFQHDIGAMNLGLFAGSPFWQEHREALEAKGVSFVAADHSAGSVFPDGRFLGVTTDPEENKRAITGFSKADAEAWETWLSDFDACAPHLFALLGSRAVPASPTALRFGKDQDVPDAVAPVLRGILADSLRANLTARFESPELQAMIAAWGLHPDTAPDIAGGCTYPFIETNIDARQGIAIATGGSGTVMMALVALIEEAGGEVRCDTTVDRIIIENNRAVGVELASGEALYASRAVLASVTPQALLNLTGNHLPAAETQRAQTWRHGPGTMMIHLALSDLPDWQAEGARKSFYVHIGPSLDDLARAYQEGVAGVLSAKPFCVVAQPTIYDPSRAPDRRHVLWIMVRCVPAEIRGDALSDITELMWSEATKEAFAERVLDLIEGYAPDLRSKILGRAIHSPLDLEALNPNLVGGDINGGSSHLDQAYGQRPFPNYPHHRMPIDGLYMCGASTWPGGGAGTGSGILAAQSMLEDLG